MQKDDPTDTGRVESVVEGDGPPDAATARAIEPGQPKLEHAVFVVLGVILTIFVFLNGLGFL